MTDQSGADGWGMVRDFCLDAPAGHVWRSDDLHTLVVHYRPSESREAWSDAAERVGMGVEPCGDGAACEVCRDLVESVRG